MALSSPFILEETLLTKNVIHKINKEKV